MNIYFTSEKGLNDIEWQRQKTVVLINGQPSGCQVLIGAFRLFPECNNPECYNPDTSISPSNPDFPQSAKLPHSRRVYPGLSAF